MNRTTKMSLALLASALALSACSKQEETPVKTATTPAAPAVATVASDPVCGKVTVANMNWQSAEVLANIDKFILSNGFGCEVELVPGDTMPTLTAMMEKGKPDVAPEAWVNSIREPLEQAVKDGRLHYAAEALIDGGVEGWWIPKYVADANPKIKTIEDALQHPELFPSAEQEGKGVVHNCPSGWSCQLTTGNAFKAWKAADQDFILLDPGSAAGLDGSIAKAYERKEGWLGYYWAPTSILGKYEMVKLDAGVPYNKEAWDSCNTKAECANPIKSDWPRAEVFTVVTDQFSKANGQANEYLSKRAWHNTTVNQLLSWMSDNQATGADAARHFLKTQPEVWNAWVTPQVAEKVKAAL